MKKWDRGCIQLSDSQSPESHNFKAVWNPVAFTHIVFSTVQNVHQPFQFSWYSTCIQVMGDKTAIRIAYLLQKQKKVIMISKKKKVLYPPQNQQNTLALL